MYQQSPRLPRYGAPAIAVGTLLGQVLGIVAVGFLITAATAYGSGSLGLSPGISFIALLVGFGFVMAINMTRNNPGVSLLLFYAFTACEGVGLGPTIARYSALSGPQVVVDAAVTTGLGMTLLAALVFLTSFDYRKLAGIAYALLIVLVIAGVVGIFVHFIHPQTFAWATLVVFTLLTLVDFARVRAADGSATAVQMATSIYLDAVNIFLALLRIFGGRR